jgi:hypothetical protein
MRKIVRAGAGIFDKQEPEPHKMDWLRNTGKSFDAAPAAPASTLLYSKEKFLKRT